MRVKRRRHLVEEGAGRGGHQPQRATDEGPARRIESKSIETRAPQPSESTVHRSNRWESFGFDAHTAPTSQQERKYLFRRRRRGEPLARCVLLVELVRNGNMNVVHCLFVMGSCPFGARRRAPWCVSSAHRAPLAFSESIDRHTAEQSKRTQSQSHDRFTGRFGRDGFANRTRTAGLPSPITTTHTPRGASSCLL